MHHVVMLGPIQTARLKPWIPDLPTDEPDFPSGMGGAQVGNLTSARLACGGVTDVITEDCNAAHSCRRWTGPTCSLWVVRRRQRGALRDFLKKERRRLGEVLGESSAEVIHAHWTNEYGAAAVAAAGRPHVVTVHDHARHCLFHLGPRYLPLFLLTHWVLRRAQAVTAVSPYVARYAQRISGREVQVVPNCLPDYVWHKEPASVALETDRILVAVLTWSHMKNVRGGLKAFALARSRLKSGERARLRLVGPGLGTGGPAEHWARRQGLAEGVEFIGPLPYERCLEAIRGASVLFHPSLEESFGSPVVEAMAYGVPVVIARQAEGCRWITQDGRYGRMTDGRSSEAMAVAVLEALRPLPLNERERLRKRARELCGAQSILETYEAIYARTLERYLNRKAT